MLQRAASNAYSWWWASHIRTKQGKWLEQNLQDMEEKVKNILIVIEEDADSFAKRAEMYYKKRPELINFVEESYRAYRALAERYNHISGELQNANNTIATVFPGQVPISMEEEEDVDNEPKVSTTNTINVPKTPEHPKFKVPARAMKKPLPRKPKKPEPKKPSSNMTKEAAQEEVDKLQKGILVLQTKKEFMVSSYESGLANLWDIEEQIEEMQEKVCELQDEFGISKVIEDNDARALMTASALKSCEETLVQLQEQQNRSMKEARIEAERIKDAEDRLKAFKDGFLQNHTDDRKLIEESNAEDSVNTNFVEELSSLNQKRSELHFISEKIKEYFEINSDSSLNVAELAEKVDELVDKVLSLENALSSQTALINRLRLETDELQKHLQSLEDCKSSLIDDSKILNNKIRELEEELNGVQDLNHSVKDESNKLQTHFTEVCRNLDDLSEELQSPIQQVDAEITDPPQVEETDRLDVVPNKDTEKEENMMTPVNGLPLPSSNSEIIGPGETEGTQEKEVRSESFPGLRQQDVQNMGSSQEEDNVLNVGGDSPKWQQLFLSGLEDREKILLTEYTSILRNYKEVKKRLSEMENKSQESLSETTAQLRELKNANAMKDAEIRSMRQKLDILQASLDQNKDSHLKKSDQSVQYKAESTIEQWKYLFSNLQGKSSGQSNLRRLEDLLREQDEMSAFTSKENPHSEEEIKEAPVAEQHPALTVEEKFRRDIDELLEENLEFWLRFSNSFHQIKKFQTAVQDLQTEFKKLKNDDKKQEGNANAADQASKSEAPPLEKRLKELQTELSFWLEQNASLKDELQRRLLSLSNIQEEIARALKMHSETEKSDFTVQQAAKFQGEVLNMQQENDKVANELQVGLDHVRRLQLEIDKTLSSQLSGSKSSRHHNPNMRHATTRTKVPLRYFIFGVKPKKPSLFSCISPALQKQYSDLRAAGAGPPIEK